MQVGQAPDIELTDGELKTGGNCFELIDTPIVDTYLDALAFMEEPMEIVVAESADENADNPVIVGCNGVFKQFFRGQPTVAKRKFVECLIVKHGRVSTPEYINNAGERARSIKQNSAHRYPFSVISDRNPKGAEWLRRRLAEVI